jgi:hypothetical protein
MQHLRPVANFCLGVAVAQVGGRGEDARTPLLPRLNPQFLFFFRNNRHPA